jgi:hypothetical protein
MQNYPLKPLFVTTFLFFLVFNGYSAVEKREYDITAAGIRIGEMTATREQIDNQTWYTLHSEVSFWFFIRVKVVYSVKSLYQDNQLIKSTVVTHTNKGDFTSSITWNKDHYNVLVDGYKYKNNESIRQPIHYNSARIYFEYPRSISNLLADNVGLIVPAENTQQDVYTVTVQGNKNRFYFKSDGIIRAVMHHPIKNFEVKRKIQS